MDQQTTSFDPPPSRFLVFLHYLLHHSHFRSSELVITHRRKWWTVVNQDNRDTNKGVKAGVHEESFLGSRNRLEEPICVFSSSCCNIVASWSEFTMWVQECVHRRLPQHSQTHVQVSGGFPTAEVVNSSNHLEKNKSQPCDFDFRRRNIFSLQDVSSSSDSHSAVLTWCTGGTILQSTVLLLSGLSIQQIN